MVGLEVARDLGLTFDVLVARKVGAPSFPEFGIGAVGPEGARYFDERSVASIGLAPEELEVLAQREETEVRRRLAAYRGTRSAPNLKNREVILVDDGLATGVTAVAAAKYIRSQNPKKIILAAPICSKSAAQNTAGYVDEVVCLSTPERFQAVGEWYADFSQTTDDEVIDLLDQAKRNGYLA